MKAWQDQRCHLDFRDHIHSGVRAALPCDDDATALLIEALCQD
jgi:hypothetical protein